MSSLPITATSLSTAATAQYRRHRSFRRVTCSVDMGRLMTYSVPTLEKVNVTAPEIGVTHREMTLGEKMRFGGFEGEDQVYKERFVVRGSQVGVNKTATVETIASLLQVTFYYCVYIT